MLPKANARFFSQRFVKNSRRLDHTGHGTATDGTRGPPGVNGYHFSQDRITLKTHYQCDLSLAFNKKRHKTGKVANGKRNTMAKHVKQAIPMISKIIMATQTAQVDSL